jgi:hypothetical protein
MARRTNINSVPSFCGGVIQLGETRTKVKLHVSSVWIAKFKNGNHFYTW